MNAGVPPSIFVDDDDLAITYLGRHWVASKGVATALTALAYPQEGHTSWYGTLHTNPGSSGLWYTFEGTDFRAVAQAIDASAVSSCTIDDVDQIVEMSSEGIVCSNNITLSAGPHNLSMTFDSEEVSFDGLFYTPIHMPDAGVDVAYHAANESVALEIAEQNISSLKVPGDRLDFEFNGISAGIYCHIFFGPEANASLSYSLDEEQPINFTLTSPVNSVHFIAEWQLIVQTPPLSPGFHTLHMSLLDSEPYSNSTGITPQLIIIQNSTQSRKLAAVPSPLSVTEPAQTTVVSLTPTSTPSPQDTHHKRTVTAAVISAVIFLLILVMFGLWFARRFFSRGGGRTIIPESVPLPVPFHQPHPSQMGRFRIAHYTTQEKFQKYRQAYGGLAESYTSPTEHDDQEPMMTRGERRGRSIRVQYVVHEDGGRVPESTHDGLAGEGEIIVISLPPVYSSTVRRSHSIEY